MMERIGKNFVHLLGDEVLDNLDGLRLHLENNPSGGAQEKCIAGQLISKLGQDYLMNNQAYHGFTTCEILDRGLVGMRALAGQSYLMDRLGCGDSSIVRPLENVRKIIAEHPNAIHYVVISVNINDHRADNHLPVWKLWTDIPQIQKRYLEIINTVQAGKEKVRPIVVLRYRRSILYPGYQLLGILGELAAVINILVLGIFFYLAIQLIRKRVVTFSSIGKIAACITIIRLGHRLISLRVTKEFCRKEHVGLAVIGSVLERFYHPILEKAKKDNIPVLDLANLFDPYQVDFYHFPWVPSVKGGTVIADHLADIIKNYNSRKPTEELFKNWTIIVT